MISDSNKSKNHTVASASSYRQCSLSLMDNIADPDIEFDENGICNYYHLYKSKESEHVYSGESGQKKLDQLIKAIKTSSKGSKYDCILGVSGGVDSTYLAHLTKTWGLNPLLVHFDNGWNSELAVMNIESILKYTGFDLYTYVVDWSEFKDIQKSFIKAHVLDIEAITDIAFSSVLKKVSHKFNIKHVIDGQNIVTEGLLPSCWTYKSQDNLINIHNRFGTIPLKTYPILTQTEEYYYKNFRSLKYLSPLNYLDYDKKSVKNFIQSEMGWRDYGGKHYESIFTRFYQGYILPEKFKIDKRKAHLSNLIFSGQMSKKEAIEELKRPIYPSHLLRIDLEFVLKKLDLTSDEFNNYLVSPPVDHQYYGTTKPFFEKYPYLKPLKGVSKIIKKYAKN